MTDSGQDQADFRTQIEKVRLGQEDIRLKQEDLRLHWERWNLDVAPLQKKAGEATAHAVEYSTLALRTLILINGGALLALPAFSQFDNGLSFTNLGWAMACFVLGLFGAGIALLSGYLSLAASTKRFSHEATARAIVLNARDNLNDEQKKNKEDADKKAADQSGKESKWEVVALVAAIVSLLLFVIGCFLGGKAIAG